MAAYNQTAYNATMLATGGGLPGPCVMTFGGASSPLAAGTATITIIQLGQCTNTGNDLTGASKYDSIQYAAAKGVFRVFAGTDASGKNGTFIGTIDGAAKNNPTLTAAGSSVSLSGGTAEGYDLYTAGKLDELAVKMTCDATLFNNNRSSPNVFLTFVPMDGHHATFIVKLVATT